MAWSYTTRDGLLTVYETQTGYAVRHNKSGQSHDLGEGVNLVFGFDGQPMSPGTPRFYKGLERLVEEQEPEMVEGYFSQKASPRGPAYGEATGTAHIPEGMRAPDRQFGYGVSGLMRDYMVRAGIPYNDALNLSKEFDAQIVAADFLTTYNGTTFTKSFTPGQR